MRVVVRFKGGAGSGHHGHSGRPGKRGGSAPGSGMTFTGLEEIADVSLPSDTTDYTYFYHSVRHTSELDSIESKGLIPGNSGKTWLSKDEIRDRGAGFAIIRVPSNVDVVEGVDVVERGISYREFTITEPLVASNIVKVVREIPLRGTSHTIREDKLARYIMSGGKDGIEDLPQEYQAWFNVTTKEYFKGGPGSGHHGHRGVPGHRGGSLPGEGSPNFLPSEERVWQGTQAEGTRQIDNIQTGNIGEALAAKALEDIYGVEFSTLNVGVNNAPIDLGGDHTAVEVKAGPATNGRTAQHWRATVSTEGKAERALVAQMTKEQKRAHNVYKQQQVMERKMRMLDEMSEIAGSKVSPVTVGVVLTPDGKRGDVFLVPGFHSRLPWNKYAVEDYYVGTYDYEG